MESTSGTPGLSPQLRLDELPAGLQSRLQTALATRERMHGLLEALVTAGTGLDLETTLTRIAEMADEAVLTAAGVAARVAAENTRLYDEARRQQGWLRASAELSISLLSGTNPRLVLAGVTTQVRELSGADLTALALPEDDDRRLAIGYASGDGANGVLGLILPIDRSLSGRVLRSGEPITVADLAADQRTAEVVRGPMEHIGPAAVFPLGVPGDVRGALTVGRRRGAPPFAHEADDAIASFTAQAGVALELAARRHDAERLTVFGDRDRIARDLHDLVIQRLYATGMSLEGTVPMIGTPEVAARVRNAVDAMDETIKDIRTTIFALQSRGEDRYPGLRKEIVDIVDEMTPMLKITPSLRLGQGLDGPVVSEVAEYVLTAVREALSNTARHASATHVDVSVEVDAGGYLTLRVADNGIGVPAGAGRSGLRNLAQRAEKLGGELRLGPAASTGTGTGTGTELIWRVPRGGR